MAFLSDSTANKKVSPSGTQRSFKSTLDRGTSYLRKVLTEKSENLISIKGGLLDTNTWTTKSNSTYKKIIASPPISSGDQNRIYTLAPKYWEDDVKHLEADVKKLATVTNTDQPDITPGDLVKENILHYNRFKLPFTTNALTRTMSHVFFTRPDCNFFDGNTLTTTANVHPTISSVYMRNPFILTGLTHHTPNAIKQNGNFNLLLSNAAASFQLTDEYIDTGDSSETLDGHKIPYGKLNTKSKASGSFTVTFDDDRNLSVYQQLKTWVDYISAVYIGEVDPTYQSVINREIDYAANVYYILTAEDGCTILFWSKYYGVFPKTIPSSQYSWNKGNSLSIPNLQVEFQYAFKEDYILSTIEEFNTDALYGYKDLVGDTVTFEPIFDTNLGVVGNTWVWFPFIDTYKSSANANNRNINNLMFRLMFMSAGK